MLTGGSKYLCLSSSSSHPEEPFRNWFWNCKKTSRWWDPKNFFSSPQISYWSAWKEFSTFVWGSFLISICFISNHLVSVPEKNTSTIGVLCIFYLLAILHHMSVKNRTAYACAVCWERYKTYWLAFQMRTIQWFVVNKIPGGSKPGIIFESGSWIFIFVAFSAEFPIPLNVKFIAAKHRIEVLGFSALETERKTERWKRNMTQSQPAL